MARVCSAAWQSARQRKSEMTRIGKLLVCSVLCFLFAPLTFAAPTITVSATAVSILGTSQTISITVTLIDPNSTGNLRVTGTGIVPVMQASTVTPGATATVGPIYGNDVILDAFGNVSTTYYKVQVFKVASGVIASTPSLQAFYAFQGSGTVDLSTATPLAPNFQSGTGGNVALPGNLSVTGTLVAPAIGPSTGQQHTLPAVASDTFALLAATQTLTNKTLSSGILLGTFTGSASNTQFKNAVSGNYIFQSSAGANNATFADASATFSVPVVLSNGASVSLIAPTAGGSITYTPFTAYLASNYTNATTTFSNVTGLSFAVAANTNYKISCDLDYQASANTLGIKIQWTGPAAPTAVTYDIVAYQSAAGLLTDIAAAAFSTSLSGGNAGVGATNYPLRSTLTLINGANAGTVQLQAAATAAGTVTIIPGSCQMQ
jgi:hypothetical protein